MLRTRHLLSRKIALRNARFASTLREAFEDALPAMIALKDKNLKEHGDKVLGTCTVAQAYQGMRDVRSLVTETSLLDSHEGIRFRGLSIPECQERLPSAPDGQEPLPEALLWLLLTGDIPTAQQVQGLSNDLASRAEVPDWVEKLILSFPRDLHPMSQFSSSILALQKDSKFAEAYSKGVNKKTLWEYAFEDMLDLVAKLPTVASIIYRGAFKDGKVIAPRKDLDLGANYAHMLGFDSPTFTELMRLYLTIHSDHEGGNVSAHTTHLVGSALSDPYLALSAGMNGLAGPLHGLANQEVLRWLRGFKEGLGHTKATKESVTKALWDTLNAGKVVPGYGHAVLRKTDPRYTAQREFALKHIRDDDMVELVHLIYETAPGVLTEHGKTKNPYPNVDAHSGVLLQNYGMVEENYYTVMFGVSRAIGVLPSLIIDRALGLPIERPKSETSESIAKLFE